MAQQRFTAVLAFAAVSVSILVQLHVYSAEPAQISFFEKKIRPLLIAKCYSCHSAESERIAGGLLLDRRQGWVTGGDSGPAVHPGDADNSLLIQAVRYDAPGLQMPPDRKLADNEIALLERWVQIGAADPRDGPGTLPSMQADPSDPVSGREHWAFRPLSDFVPPATSTWATTAIDQFVDARRTEARLDPSPQADRQTLLRRVFVQLTGLPPTIQQAEAYLSDDRPDAYERLVDQLLQSPQFGEQWGRHWLDLARYADSNGLDENFLFREAWRYRNYVIDSINADLPFDQFLIEQIAGDLLPAQSTEQRDRQRTAAGFMVIGPKVLLGNDAEQRKMDVADEQIDTIGRAILGQTLGCARCHDHKFDPFPTADYYALAGIMTSTQVMETRYMLGQQRLMEQLIGLGTDGEQVDGAYEQYWRDRPQLQERLTQAKTAIALLEKQDNQALAAHAKKHEDAVAPEVLDLDNSTEQRKAAQQSLIDTLNQLITSPPAIPPRAMVPSDLATPDDEWIRLAGQFDRKGKQIPRGFLSVLGSPNATIPPSASGRLELAHWLTDPRDGAGQLTARVFANRVWHHLIGRGIVRTVDNFGRTGEAPSHPQLLDYLANRLIQSGWSVKSLVREVVTSETFKMSSQHQAAAELVDPDNNLLWRAHRRRMTPETFRDAMLMAAEQLDLTPMNSTVWYLGDQATAVGANNNRRRTDFPCRSLYLPIIRNDLPELFDVFDFADPHAVTGMRPDTMVATQGLFVLNDDSVMAAAESTAYRLFESATPQCTDSVKVQSLFERVLGSPPTPQQRVVFADFIQQSRQELLSEHNQDLTEIDIEKQVWTMACHALFASSRFQIIE